MENTYYNQENNAALNPKKIKVMKAKARGQLLGNYGPIIGATLLVIIISTIATGIITPMFYTGAGLIPTIIYFAASFIISLLTYFFYTGIYRMHLAAARGEELLLGQLLFPIKNGSNRFLIVSFVLALISFLQVIPSQIASNRATVMATGTLDEMLAASQGFIALNTVTIIISIAAIILVLGLSLAPLLLIDNPDMTAMEALATSWKYMKGNKWRLFVLELSFIGLCLLGILTFGIAFLWIEPYMQQSIIVFYEAVVCPPQSQPQPEPCEY